METAKTKSPKKQPARTIKKIRAAKVIGLVSENIRNGKRVSVSAAMREVGYSDSYAARCTSFVSTKSAQALLEEYFPDNYLHAKTKELMEASKLDSYVFPKAKNKGKPLTNEEIKFIVEQMAGATLIYIRDSDLPPGRIAFFRFPDAKARKDGVEIAYKLKGAFKADGLNPEDRNPFAKMTDEELAAAIKEAKAVLTKKA